MATANFFAARRANALSQRRLDQNGAPLAHLFQTVLQTHRSGDKAIERSVRRDRFHIAHRRAGKVRSARRCSDGATDGSEVVQRLFEFGDVFCETSVGNGLAGKTSVELFDRETVPAFLDFMK